MKEITRNEILNAMALGIVRITKDPTCADDDPQGIVCSVAPLDENGDQIAAARQWFWFAGHEGEEANVRDYLRNHPLQDIVEDLHAVLSNFQSQTDPELADEWEGYRACIPTLPDGWKAV